MIPALLLASGGLNVLGTVAQMGSAYSDDKINAVIADTNAKIAREDAKMRAVDIRKAGEAAAGSATAAMAASGVDVSGSGTADAIRREITQATERDALMALLTGDRTADQYAENARGYRKDARNVATAGALQVGSTVLGATYDYGKWKRSQE